MLRYLKHLDRVMAVACRRRESAGLAARELPDDALTAAMAEAQAALGPLLAAYGRDVSTPDMAISLQSASLLAALCRLARPRRILDTGSGFSSLVVRRYAPAAPPAEIWSADDDEQWLKRTGAYLRQHGLQEHRLVPWAQFAAGDERSFDLIFHDLGQAERIRLKALPEVCRRLAPGGLLLLDDFHKHWYRIPARRELARAGLTALPLRHHTLDHYGRYAALARRAA